MINDPGAWVITFGETLAGSLAKTCVGAGYKPRQQKLDNDINIARVGNGTSSITHCFERPIAIPTENKPSQMFELSAGIVEVSKKQTMTFQDDLVWMS